MNIDKIAVGKNAPWDCNVIIEIAAGGAPVKYELDKDSGALFVDRMLHTSMLYPANYGFIPHTLSDDGDPVDALVLTQSALVPGCVVRARPVGVLIMEDESGQDEKILMVPVDKLFPYHKDVQNHTDIPQIILDQISHFFERYKDLEPNKWVKIIRWGDAKEAADFIAQGMKNGQAKSV